MRILFFIIAVLFQQTGVTQILKQAIPDKLVVLTFDDASSTHATVVAPLLKKYGFGGTFYVCEFPPDFADTTKYMSWAQISALHDMGFEIGNHTGHHKHVTTLDKTTLIEELEFIEDRCRQHEITPPNTFAYPAYNTDENAVQTLAERKYWFARTGGGRPYNPMKDHPYLIPSFSTTGDSRQRIMEALEQAKDGQIVVLTIHGVPDYAHDWVTTPPDLFREYLEYLDKNGFRVIAMRDLSKYIDFEKAITTLPTRHFAPGESLKKTEPQETGIPVVETGATPVTPVVWIDKDTGHKLKRLSDGKNDARSFYFHNVPFLKSPDGTADWMIYYGTTEKGRQLFRIDLQSLESKQLTNDHRRKRGEILGTKRREAFYQSQDSVFAVNIDKGTTRLVYVFPEDFKSHITTLNADETKLAGTWAGPEKAEILEKHPSKGEFFDRIFDAKIPHTLFTVDIETGQLDKIHSENTWLGHIQFSTTDPDLLMFCHEGPWHKVDRIWHVNIRTKAVKKIHERTVYREIAGHEFWSWDGEKIWYDLQIPRGETFFLASHTLENGRLKKWEMDRNEWSIHFNISNDQKLFAGDGGDPGQVAKAPDGMWIYLFEQKGKKLKSKRLVNMKHHNYRLEPNVHFSPDDKWIIFRADFGGGSQVYAVEVAQSK